MPNCRLLSVDQRSPTVAKIRSTVPVGIVGGGSNVAEKRTCHAGVPNWRIQGIMGTSWMTRQPQTRS
jgi:hypothetical protein